MGNEFAYDVFLSHSAKDKAVVRLKAEKRLSVLYDASRGN
jgi:hypothetical protein